MYDSLHKESAQQFEYLNYSHWLSHSELPYFDFQVAFEQSIVYSPGVIIEALKVAKDCLDNYPGENIEQRRATSEGWLGWWIEELARCTDNGFAFMKTYNVNEFNKLGEEFLKSNQLVDFLNGKPIPAVWFVAGLEGHEGHRYALDSILSKKRIIPVIVIEREEYLLRKDRKYPFLPLELRVSMYSHYLRRRGNRGIILCNPYSTFVSDQYLDDIYIDLMERLHAIVCLPNANDPEGTFNGKIKRSVFLNSDWVIPYLDVPSTTQRVRI